SLHYGQHRSIDCVRYALQDINAPDVRYRSLTEYALKRGLDLGAGAADKRCRNPRAVIPVTAATPPGPIFGLAPDRNENRVAVDEPLSKREGILPAHRRHVGDTGQIDAALIAKEEIVGEAVTDSIDQPIPGDHALRVRPLGLTIFPNLLMLMVRLHQAAEFASIDFQ